jgi:hypothetical protein
MSRSSGVPVPSEHPDQDLLADLAAEVLPRELAARVEEHVMGCANCAALLADAEGMRSLLRQSEPERMPAEVWARLERSLIIARQGEPAANPAADTQAFQAFQAGRPLHPGQAARPSPFAPASGSGPATSGSGSARTPFPEPAPFPVPAVPPSQPGPPSPAGRSSRSGPPSQPIPAKPAAADTGATRMIRRVPGGGSAAGATGRFAAIGNEGPPTSRLSRMSRPAQTARRQALEEQRADRPSRLRPILLATAATVAVLGVGGAALQFFHPDNGSADSATSAGAASKFGAAAGAPILGTVESTNTNYTRKQLQSQVQTLITTSQQTARRGTAATSAAPDAAAAKPNASASALASQSKAAAGEVGAGDAASGQQLLRSPAALRACLTAIGADQQPIAVDLAEYAGQEAAIIVLPADGGGYEVNIVARDCRAGNDGTIDVVTLAKP